MVNLFTMFAYYKIMTVNLLWLICLPCVLISNNNCQCHGIEYLPEIRVPPLKLRLHMKHRL